ncbi:MAG TPA: hypothetical protein VFU23_06140 [Gemmatimonadales bacterium]|nr:hypothetical protein [Gemmatimonadales bacterium]
MLIAGALSGSLALAPTSLNAQPEPMSASLARRLAEAADGYRDGLEHWFTIDIRSPHTICGVFDTFDAARTSTRSPECRVFGPVVTPPDLGWPGPIIMLGCTHQDNPISSIWRPSVCPKRVIPMADVRLMEFVVITERDTIRLDLKREGIDALFLTPSSIQKFVVPYYARLNGPDFVKMLWDSILVRGRRP